jgi:hypothetical protein
MKVQDMTQRYRKFQRSWGTWYAFDNATGNSVSLKTRIKAEAGYPERYAQVNLGHNSKAMTRAYSRKAEVEMPSLSDYERRQKAIIGSHETEPVTQNIAA